MVICGIEKFFYSHGEFFDNFNRSFFNDFSPGICKFIEISIASFDDSNTIETFIFEMALYFPARFLSLAKVLSSRSSNTILLSKGNLLHSSSSIIVKN